MKEQLDFHLGRIVGLVRQAKEIDKMRAETEKAFDSASKYCEYYYPPDTDDPDDADSMPGCTNRAGTLCFINECPLDRK